LYKDDNKYEYEMDAFSYSYSYSLSMLTLSIVSQRTAKKCTKSYYAHAQLLFCSLYNTDRPPAIRKLFYTTKNMRNSTFLLSEEEIVAN